MTAATRLTDSWVFLPDVIDRLSKRTWPIDLATMVVEAVAVPS